MVDLLLLFSVTITTGTSANLEAASFLAMQTDREFQI